MFTPLFPPYFRLHLIPSLLLPEVRIRYLTYLIHTLDPPHLKQRRRLTTDEGRRTTAY